MEKNHGNALLDEYFAQVGNILTDDEKKLYDEYSFYDVYEIEIAGCNPCNVICFAAICAAILVPIAFCVPETICGCNWVNSCCFGCSCFTDCRTSCCSTCGSFCCICDKCNDCCGIYHESDAVSNSCYCCDVCTGKSDGGDDCGCSFDCNDKSGPDEFDY